MIDVFTGYDPREAVGWHVFAASALERTSAPLVLRPLQHKHHAAAKVGSNDFTFSRFLIPYLMGWSGTAIFVDGCDMLCQADLAELEAMRETRMGVQVVKHDYQTKFPIKYAGTSMECGNPDYVRKNWASVMLINCSHMAWRKITPATIGSFKPLDLLGLRFIDDDRIGELPKEWNWLADEYGENPDAKLLHWTAGIPGMPNYARAPHAAAWHAQAERMNAAC